MSTENRTEALNVELVRRVKMVLEYIKLSRESDEKRRNEYANAHKFEGGLMHQVMTQVVGIMEINDKDLQRIENMLLRGEWEASG